LLSFYINNIHSNGECTLILVGSEKTGRHSTRDPAVSNVRWVQKLTIDKYRNNDDDLIFNGLPELLYSETANGVVNDNGDEVTLANVDLSLLTPFSGKLERVSIYSRLSNTENDFGLSTIYNLRPSSETTGSIVDVDLSEYVQYASESQITNEVNDSNINFSVPLVIIDKPTYYDLKVTFDDGKDSFARNDIGEPLSIILKNIPFSGVESVASLNYENVIGVPNVKWVNSPNEENTESGTLGTFNTAIELTWLDINLLSLGSFPLRTTDIYGIPRDLTYRNARTASKYAVWMFISNEREYSPDWQHPGRVVLYNANLFNQSLFNQKSLPTPDGKGAWYFKGFFGTNYATIDVPRGHTVSFWVGIITKSTKIPTLDYYRPNLNPAI